MTVLIPVDMLVIAGCFGSTPSFLILLFHATEPPTSPALVLVVRQAPRAEGAERCTLRS